MKLVVSTLVAAIFAVFAVLMAVLLVIGDNQDGGAIVVLVLCASVAAKEGFDASRECYEFDAFPDGHLEIKYGFRRNAISNVRAIRSIQLKSGASSSTWIVTTSEATFRLSRYKATPLIESLVRRNPSIELTGYAVPDA